MPTADIEIEIVPSFNPHAFRGEIGSHLMAGLDIMTSEFLSEDQVLEDSRGHRLYMHPKTFKRPQRSLEIKSDVRAIIQRRLAAEIRWLKEAGHDVWGDPDACCRD